jgi:hypothetical protein
MYGMGIYIFLVYLFEYISFNINYSHRIFTQLTYITFVLSGMEKHR